MLDARIDRRSFMKLGGLATCGVAIAGAEAFGGRRERPAMADLSKDDFAPHVGEEFTIEDGESGRVTARLTSAEGKRAGRVESFSLVFTADQPVPSPQGVRTVSHPSVGSHEIFLVPIGGDGTTTSYEAVFTRMV